ncbi:hypothetical protein [Salinibacterium sp. PAMC 21357]|uniref:hypothetical protein n=1 Tax=Salinibacterium sp. PAMC 21357 TaxID=1112215 RepID=UPI000289B011|nr:hypothetical protein [Salinibacterium sp. PAMC 21357]
MDEAAIGIAPSGSAWLARDFIPESHRSLPMLRLFLPLTDERGTVVRWSTFSGFDRASASVDWFELADRVADEHPMVRDLLPCQGVLDDATAHALRDAVGDINLHSFQWDGYGDAPKDAARRRIFGEDYSEFPPDASALKAGVRVAAFAWDDDGSLAWGSQLYPDSLVVAAEPAIFRQLVDDKRLDTISIIAQRDTLPPSSGD